MTDAAAAPSWFDHFFASYYARRPVNATFIGVHDHDHRLPDLSDSGLGDVEADMTSLLSASDEVDTAPLTPVERVDLRVARGFLRIQLAEYASGHFWRGNPSFYTGEAVFGVMSLFLADFAPATQRAEAAVARLEGIPTFLAQARSRIRRAPASWTERARRECTGALAFLDKGIDHLGAEIPAAAARLRAAADRAATAFSELAAWLESDLAMRTVDNVGCGEEMLALYLREGHFLERGADEVAAYARTEMERATGRLSAGAAALGAATPAEALARLAKIHATTEGYYDRYREIHDEVRAVAEEHDLVTWPELPVRFVPRPAWSRDAAPHLYFLFYRAPAAFGGPPVHEYLVTPIDGDLPEAERRALLEANNDGVIRLNHVVHHGTVGHHVQNGLAARTASRVGRIAAVDCASRIAMFAGGTMAEGWACYATDLIREVGGLTPLESYAELHSRVRMCARAVVDVELHSGRMTMDDAVRLYRETAGMSAAAARGEATKNSMFPGAALMYLTGSDGIHALRSVAKARQGASFTLRGFHDRLLSWGSIPVTLAGQLLMHEIQEDISHAR